MGEQVRESKGRIASKISRSSFQMALFRSISRLNVLKSHMRMCSKAAVDDVLLEKIGDKGLITLNRPKALNALTLSMVHKIQPQLKEWEKSGDVNLVVIKGAGSKAFCAGGDVVALTKAAVKGEPMKDEFMYYEYQLNHTIGHLSMPYVALIDGVVMGGGVGLSVHGKYRVATEKTMFAMPETAIGLFPDVGGGHFLPRLTGQLGMFLALTGHRLKGRDVLKAGVATHFVEKEKLGDLESSLLNLSAASHESVSQLLTDYQNQSPHDADTPFSLASIQDKIDRIFGGGSVEDILELLHKEGDDWSQKQIATLNKMSPTSLKITYRQIKEGAHLSLHDVLGTRVTSV